MEAPMPCIISLGQQGLPELVARKLKWMEMLNAALNSHLTVAHEMTMSEICVVRKYQFPFNKVW